MLAGVCPRANFPGVNVAVGLGVAVGGTRVSVAVEFATGVGEADGDRVGGVDVGEGLAAGTQAPSRNEVINRRITDNRRWVGTGETHK